MSKVGSTDRALRDLLSLLALPAIASGRTPEEVLQIALAGLSRVVPVELAFGRVLHQGQPLPQNALHLQGTALQDGSARLQRALSEAPPFAARPELALERAGLPEGMRAVAFPLGFYAKTGELLFASFRPDFPTPTEMMLLRAAASLIASAVQSALDLQEVQRARDREAFLSSATRALSSSLDPETLLHELAARVTEALAVECQVDVLSPEGILQTVAHLPEAAVHAGPEITAAALRVLSTGKTEHAGAVEGEAGGWHAESPLCAYLAVPLMNRGRVLGVMTLLQLPEGRPLREEDVALAEDLGLRAGGALDNAQLYREAQDAISARDTFLSIASHELNTPLAALKLNVQLVRRSLRAVTAISPALLRAEERFASTDRQLTRLADLIRGLLDFSRFSAATMRLDFAEVDYAELVREAVARASEDGARQGSTVELQCPEALGGVSDKLRVDQVVTNLLSNAVKYGRGQPIQVRLAQVEDQLEFQVRDRGIGIAPEEQARLFRRFERLVDARNYSGWGLGLWIVKQVVDALGGVISVASQVGHGTQFTVRLPLRQPAASEAEPQRLGA